jgi:hypothetical protein
LTLAEKSSPHRSPGTRRQSPGALRHYGPAGQASRRSGR